MSYVLDTNAVIALFNKQPNFIKQISQYQPEQIFLSVITVFELYYGAYNGSQGHFANNMARIKSMPFTVLTFEDTDAKKAGELRTQLKKQPIGSYDLLIAAQTLERGYTLVTNNVREFSRVKELNIEDWTN